MTEGNVADRLLCAFSAVVAFADTMPLFVKADELVTEVG
jgi:hypothetical protein